MRMATHKLSILECSTSDYGEDIKSYPKSRNIEMYLSYFNRSFYNANNIELLSCTYVGLTKDTDIKKGDMINDKYIVEFVMPADRDIICYLKEVGNDGRV